MESPPGKKTWKIKDCARPRSPRPPSRARRLLILIVVKGELPEAGGGLSSSCPAV